jgi:hypothetical protein
MLLSPDVLSRRVTRCCAVLRCSHLSKNHFSGSPPELATNLNLESL